MQLARTNLNVIVATEKVILNVNVPFDDIVKLMMVHTQNPIVMSIKEKTRASQTNIINRHIFRSMALVITVTIIF